MVDDGRAMFTIGEERFYDAKVVGVFFRLQDYLVRSLQIFLAGKEAIQVEKLDDNEVGKICSEILQKFLSKLQPPIRKHYREIFLAAVVKLKSISRTRTS